MAYRPLSDTILCARTKTKYYGAYPAGFLERARILLGVGKQESLFHVCGGKAKDYNGKKGGILLSGYGENDFTIDIDPGCHPDILGDVRDIGLLDFRDVTPVFQISNPDIITYNSDNRIEIRVPEAILIDRPYTPEDADNYNFGRDYLPNLNDLTRDCLNILPVGKKVGVLDYFFPSAKNGKCIGIYPVIAGTNCRIRVFTIWEKLK